MSIQVPAHFRLISLFIVMTLTMLIGHVITGEPFGKTVRAASEEDLVQTKPTPIQVGEFEDITVNLIYDEESSWRRTIQHPDAAYIKFHFAEMDLLPGDKVTVSDPSGTQLYTYPGAVMTADEDGIGFWAISIVGDTAIVELHPNQARRAERRSDFSRSGVRIDKYARGYSERTLHSLYESDAESTCGDLERTDVACYENSYPTEFERANAVVRILINGASHCTGWRVSASNLLFTNEHCITSQSELDQMEFWFDYQRPLCETGGTNTPTIVTGDEFLLDDYDLDFALVTLNDFATIQSFGYLELDPRTTVNGEELYIPQHGAGNPKEFGIDSDANPPDNLCQVDINITDGRGTNTDIGYFCDTIGGSSGSPVLARSTHKVVALHHLGNSGAPNCTVSGNNVNSGARIELIWPLVSAYFPDLTITKSASPSPVTAGNTLTYSLNITNGTESDLTGVEVTDDIPADTTYVDGSATCGGSETGGTVTFPIGALNSSADVDCSFQVTVSASLGSAIIFADDMESGAANWSVSHDPGLGAYDWSLDSSNAHSPTMAWFADDVAELSDQYLTLASPVTLNDNTVLRFWHHYDTESIYDGGVVEISVDDGAHWIDLGPAIRKNGYNSTISTSYSSPIEVRPAFSGDSDGYLETSIDLDSYAGEDALIRFRMASDLSVADDGWHIDDVQISNEDVIENTACATADGGNNDCDTVRTAVEEAPCVTPSAPDDVESLIVAPTTLQLDWTSTGADYYDVWSADNDPYFTPGAECSNPAPINCSSTSSSPFTDAALGNAMSNYSYAVVARNACGATGTPHSNRTGEFDFALVAGAP